MTLAGGLLRTQINGNATIGSSVVVTGNSSLETSRFDGSSTQQTHSFGSLALVNSQLSVLASTGNYTARFTALSLSGSSTIDSASGSTLEIAGPATGPGLTKTGAGTLILSGTSANTLSGNLAINAGTLTLNKGNGTIAVNRDLVIGSSGAATVNLNFNEQIADTSAVTMGSNSLFNVNGRTETIGSLATAATTAQVDLGAGTLQAGRLNTSTSFAGTIQGTGNLVKQGSGTMTLGGANTYTGNTTIQGGTLTLGNANRLAAATVVQVSSGARFDLAGFNQTVAGLEGSGSILMGSGNLTTGGSANRTFSGSIAGSGGYTHQGSGNQVLSGVNTYTGLTSVTGGQLTLGRDGALSSLSSLRVGGATFGTGGYSQSLVSLDLTANATFDFGSLSSVLKFDTVATNLGFLNGNTLTITNWTGTFATTGGVDQLIAMDGLFSLVNSTTPSIQFVIGGTPYNALFLARPDLGVNAVEVVPVPEPTTMALLAVAGLLFFGKRMRAGWFPTRPAAFTSLEKPFVA